jgi:hypothetical protein
MTPEQLEEIKKEIRQYDTGIGVWGFILFLIVIHLLDEILKKLT